MKAIGLVRDSGTTDCVYLYEHEMEQLLEAVRRDYRREHEQAQSCDAEEKRMHSHRARDDLRLLETLKPKKPSPLPLSSGAQVQLQAEVELKSA